MTELKTSCLVTLLMAFACVFMPRASHAAEASMQDLDAIVGDAKMVNYGESSHFMAGLHYYAGQAFRHLAQEKGFRVFVFESAWGVDDAMQGFFASDAAEPTQEESFFLNAFYSTDTIELLKWIREFNRQHPKDPIRVTGYQPEQPVTDFRAITAYAGKSKNVASADLKQFAAVCKVADDHKGNLDYFKSFFEQRRTGKPTFTPEERAACVREIEGIERFVEQNKTELIAASSLNAWREAQLHFHSFKTYMVTISSAADQLALGAGLTPEQELASSKASYTTIDNARFEIFQTLRETRFPGKKVFLWMHNWHATEHSDEVESVGPGGIPKGTISIGTRLAQAYGKQLVTIGSIVACPSCTFPDRDDAFAPRFAAEFGQGSALINLSGSSPQLNKLGVHSPGSIIQQFNGSFLVVNDLSRQFDAVYYLSQSKRVGDDRTAGESSGIGQTPAEHYFVKTRLLINPDTGVTIDKGVIEVSGGKILRFGKLADIAIPSDAKVLNYSDKFVIPGLIETHGHFYTNLAFGHTANDILPRLYLPAGVTSVLSPGSGNPEGDFGLKQLIDSGRVHGPRLFLAGEYLEMAPPQAPWMDPVATEKEAIAKIDYWYSRGATAVKLYAGMKGDIMRAAIAHAHWLGMKVHGHLGATTWTDAIEMGIDVLHHGIYGFPEIEPEGLPPLALGAVLFAPPSFGFDKWYKLISETDLTQPKYSRVFKAAADSKVVFVPTTVALEPYDRKLDHMDEQQPFYAPDAWKKVEGRFEMKKNPYAAVLMKKNLEFIKRASDAGCLLALGTDFTTLQILPGFSLWREMELFAEAGLKPMEVLKAATINGAYVLGRSSTLGSFEPGKLADFVVLNANPLENISNVRSVYRVIKGGVIYVPDELLKPLKGRVH